MDYENKIFDRMNLKQLCSFLLEGVEEDTAVESLSYRERLHCGSKAIYKRPEDTYKDNRELDKAVADLSEALIVYESVYTEIGMKFGARIIHQLLHEGDTVKFDRAKTKE